MVNKILKIINLICIKLSDINFNKQYNFKYIFTSILKPYNKIMNIGIIGQGFVGNAIYQKFKTFFNVYTYDLNLDLCNSNFDYISKTAQ